MASSNSNPNFHCLDSGREKKEYRITSEEEVVIVLVDNPDGTNTLNVRVGTSVTALTVVGKDMEVWDWWGWGDG